MRRSMARQARAGRRRRPHRVRRRAAPHAVDADRADAVPMVAVHVALKVEPKGTGGHGRARVLEREVRVGVARTPTRDSVTVVQAPFENDDTGASTTFWSRSR